LAAYDGMSLKKRGTLKWVYIIVIMAAAVIAAAHIIIEDPEITEC